MSVLARNSPPSEQPVPQLATTARRPTLTVTEPWAGNDDAFARLYDETSARVYGVVLRVIRDPAQAEEVTQEVYLEIWQQANRYDSARGSAIAWAMTIAHRRAVDRVRSVEASRRRDLAHCEQNHRSEPYDETSEAAEWLAAAQMVRDALANLPVKQRRVIELAYFGGYTQREIALLLEIPLGTAKTRLRDGLIQLRRSSLTTVA